MDLTEIQNMMRKHLTDEDFNDLLKDQVEYIETLIKENPETQAFEPMLIVGGFKVNNVREMSIIVFPGVDFNKDKYKALYGAGLKFAENYFIQKAFMPVCVFLLSEAWVKTFKNEKEHTKSHISDYEDKKEAIICGGLTVDKRGNMAQIIITRDKEDRIIVGEVVWGLYEKDKVSGESDLIGQFFHGYSDGFRKGEVNKGKERTVVN